MNIRESLLERLEKVNGEVKSNMTKYLSISQVLGMLVEPFDSKGVAQKTHDKHFNNPESQYYQMSVEQIMEAWSAKGAESCKYGSLLDDYIGMNLNQEPDAKVEMWKLDNNYDWDERLNNLVKSFEQFMELVNKSGDMEFITREKTLYYKVPNTDYYIKGRFDALFYNKRTNKYVIVDWKSSGTVDKKKTPWTKQLFGPMMKYPALNWYTYTTQVHFYKLALLQSGYLPEGTNPDDIEVLIVQLPGHECADHKMYEIHKQAFEFDEDLMNKLFMFASKKNDLMNTMENI